MVHVRVEQDVVRIGERFSMSFQRTLRIPDDGKSYPLPPSLGTFPIHQVAAFAERLPNDWRQPNALFLPMYQYEALWIAFQAAAWKPNAVKVGIGMINAVSGAAWDLELRDDPQDYLVCPDQPWLDGINAGTGTIRQFVAAPLGKGYTVEGQLTGKEETGGIQIAVFEPKLGRFPDQPPATPDFDIDMIMPESVSTAALGLGAGGKMHQQIYPDPYGVATWDDDNYATITIYLLNSEQYRAITGQAPPATPIDAQTYTTYGLPWFDLYDETAGDVTAPSNLAGIKSIAEKDVESGAVAPAAEVSAEVQPAQVRKLQRNRTRRRN
jgi:hypothetical protein